MRPRDWEFLCMREIQEPTFNEETVSPFDLIFFKTTFQDEDNTESRLSKI